MRNITIHSRTENVFTETTLQNTMFEAFRKLGVRGLEVVAAHPYVETEHVMDGVPVLVRVIKISSEDYCVSIKRESDLAMLAVAFMDKFDL